MGGGQHVTDTPVEAFHPAVGLGMARSNKSVVDAVLDAALVEGVASGGFTFAAGTEAVGELFAIVGEDFFDGEGRVIDQAVEEGPSLSGRFFGQEFDIYPARGPINGHEQVLMRGFIGHPRQVVHIDMDKPWGIVLILSSR